MTYWYDSLFLFSWLYSTSIMNHILELNKNCNTFTIVSNRRAINPTTNRISCDWQWRYLLNVSNLFSSQERESAWNVDRIASFDITILILCQGQTTSNGTEWYYVQITLFSNLSFCRSSLITAIISTSPSSSPLIKKEQSCFIFFLLTAVNVAIVGLARTARKW